MINSYGIEAIFQDINKFYVEGNLTDIFINGVKTKANCGDDGFKYGTVLSSEWISVSGSTLVTIDSVESDFLTSNLDLIWYEESPHMADGRPIVRSDSRPLNTQTIFTMCGDSENAIGDGKELVWDFSNDDDLYTGSDIPSGYKAKEIKIKFKCPVHIKDGCIYFFEAPWGAYVQMDIVVPGGSYYPNPAGPIPSYMLGIPGDKMYSQATNDLVYQRYVNKHHIYGSLPIGDELNAEGSSESPLPIGWYIRGLIVTTEDDNISKGYASLEMYRCHTVILPGQTITH